MPLRDCTLVARSRGCVTRDRPCERGVESCGKWKVNAEQHSETLRERWWWCLSPAEVDYERSDEAAKHYLAENAGGHHRHHRGLPRVGDSARRRPPRGVPLVLVGRLLRGGAVARRQPARVRQVHAHKQPPLGAALRPRRPVDRRADPRGRAGLLVRRVLRRGPRGLRDEAGPHVDGPRGDKSGAERRHGFRPEAHCTKE